MRVVLDTGVLIAALISRDTPRDQTCQARWKKRFELFISECRLREFRRVSRYPRLRTFLKLVESGNMTNGLHCHALLLSELPRLDVSLALDDNLLLATAVAGEADFLVSGDSRTCWP